MLHYNDIIAKCLQKFRQAEKTMSDLKEARKQINEIDRQMAELFEKRMMAAQIIAAHKKSVGMPILDEKREREVIISNSAYVSDPVIREHYVSFIESTMKVSRAYQSRLNDGMRIAYSGTLGAFAHIAAGKIFGYCGQRIPFGNFTDAYDSVVKGECDCAVLPMENSYSGDVGQVIDMRFSGPLFVSGVYDLPVVHDLCAVKGAEKSNVKKVVSHPQALSQCAGYISRNGFEQTQYENTAMAAEYVASLNDKSVAAICSEECAEIFGLTVLERHINESRSNTTRFGVFTRAEVNHGLKNDPENRFILMFTVQNKAGALAEAINILGRHGYNMTALRSRPMKELLWSYYFYVECEGTLTEKEAAFLKEELSCCCDRLKLAGAYKCKTL